MRWNDHAEYWLFRGAATVLSALPTGWNQTLGRGLGRLMGSGVKYRRPLVSRQLTAVFPGRSAVEIKRLTNGVYRHLGQTMAEILGAKPEVLAGKVDIDPGWSRLDELMASGTGVIAVSAHLGNFELGGRILAGRYRVLDVVKPMRNPLFDRYLRQERARHGITTVPMDSSGHAVLSHLRSGGLVSLLIDQDAGAGGVRTGFLGRPASTWPGAARLAVRTGCPVVPVVILRQPNGRHRLRIGEVVDAAGATDSGLDIVNLTSRISAAVEKFIAECPEQWFWVHRRWKGAAEAKTYHEES